ncbi:PHP domain-containing protein [Natronospora cellulosivora (SeqCode)]
MVADLHVHSIFSDGSYSPEQLVDMAIEKGLKAIALADHDTVEGVEKMIIAGKEKGIEVIPAIELSTYCDKAEIHILGYKIDYKADFFLEEVKRLFKIRQERAEKMVKKLNEIGVKISYLDVKELAGDKYIGRPHIAKALLHAGYINKIEEAFTKEYIANGGRAYVPKERIAPENAIELIHKAGGVAVLAHPYLVNKGDSFDREGIEKLRDIGLDGVEVYHSKHDQETSKYYKKIAEDLDLLITGGSDFHGETSPDVELGDIRINEESLRKVKEA